MQALQQSLCNASGTLRCSFASLMCLPLLPAVHAYVQLNQSTEYVISSLFDNLPAPYVCGSAIVIDGLVNGSSVVISCNASIPETLMLANKVIAYNATRLCDCRPAPYVTTIQVINAGYQSTPENATAAITNYTDSVSGGATTREAV
jgi:hypothetical protein